jgi:ATP-dependent exoDNAse (exonuclease V) alpha subunit
MQHSDLQITQEFRDIYRQLANTPDCYFITGKAGTGKSTLLRLFRHYTKKKLAILAPTGVAALHVNGQTIHSFFGFPPRVFNMDELKVRNRKLYKSIDAIVIDEVSMVRADMVDQIDQFMRRYGKTPGIPFGGCQLIFFGDLYQLPPVISTPEEMLYFRNHYESPYFFSAKVFKQIPINMIELHQVFRQDSLHFIRLLDNIRSNQFDEDDLEDLNQRFDPDAQGLDNYIVLSARNQTVNEINTKRLEALATEQKTYLATVSRDFNPQVAPTETALHLKIGAQVMFVINDTEKRFVNGTIGKVIQMDIDTVKVRLTNDEGDETDIDVKASTWEVHRHSVSESGEIKAEITGSFTQIPLKLAWAITIHKSQGKTFDRVIIDLGKGAFEHGQTYVALSRCRTLEGIVLKAKLRPQDVMTDPVVVEFMEGSR